MQKDNHPANTIEKATLPLDERSGERRVLFPGSFNPFTKGHADIVERGLALFDSITIAIGYNEQKAEMNDVESRIASIKAIYADEPRVRIIAYSCLTIEIAKKEDACAILRSVRSVKDYEYELQMADVNRRLSGIETIVLFARPELSSISSSVVRELQHFGYDTSEFLV